MRREFFSEFTIAEQRLGLELDAQVTNHKQQKEKLTAAANAAKARLAARTFLDEVRQQPDLDDEFVARLGAAHDRYFRQQEIALQQSEAGLSQLDSEWQSLSPQLKPNADVMQSIWSYRDKYRAEPVIHEDMPQPDQLNGGIYTFEETVQKELEETRALLTAHQPELLQRYAFRVAEESIQFGGAGMAVGQAADELRSARDALAKLRAQISQA